MFRVVNQVPFLTRIILQVEQFIDVPDAVIPNVLVSFST